MLCSSLAAAPARHTAALLLDQFSLSHPHSLNRTELPLLFAHPHRGRSKDVQFPSPTINHALARTESKFCTPNGSRCNSNTIGLLVRRHIVAGEFHYVGKEASTRWATGPDLSMMAEAGAIDTIDETFREYERVVDPKYLEQIRAETKRFSTKLLSRRSRLAECAIRNFKRGKNTIRPRSLRKLIMAIHDLQNRSWSNQHVS